MGLIVQKYGGTSVGSVERIQAVAKRIYEQYLRGNEVVVVVSAMSGETDRLINLAKALSKHPAAREYSALVSTGEQVSIALVTLALHSLGCAAVSLNGAQISLHTQGSHKDARIQSIETTTIKTHLSQGRVVVIAGFQGIDDAGDITTLGRGGSDTSAVAIAAVLNADECQIYTDVAGVYTADPYVVPKARLLRTITFEEMLELASLGAKVLQTRAVELVGKYHVPLRVLSSFSEGAGTLITFEEHSMEQVAVSGIAFNRNEAKLTLLGVPDIPGVASTILNLISEANIPIDMIIQNVSANGVTDFTFTLQREDYEKAHHLLEDIAHSLKAKGILGDTHIAKISLVGVGMRSHSGVANTMFKVLGQEGINIKLIATSEIKISVVVDEKYLELGVRALHSAFGLDRDATEEFDPLPAKKIPNQGVFSK